MRPSSVFQREALSLAVETYAKALATDVTAARYLLGRGVEETTARTARLGVVADPLPGHERYVGKLAIPYMVAGHPVALRFRCIQDHDCKELQHGKYLSMPDEPSRIYGVEDIIAAGDEFHLTEGEPDKWILNQLGYYAGAVPGANNWMPHHRRMLAGFSRIYVWGDGDSAGAEFVGKVCRSLRQAKGVQVPRGMDVNALFLAGGEAAIRNLID